MKIKVEADRFMNCTLKAICAFALYIVTYLFLCTINAHRAIFLTNVSFNFLF